MGAVVANTLKIEAWLVSNPTSYDTPGADGAYGGTVLGLMSEIAIAYEETRAELTAFEWHNLVYEIIEGSINVGVSARMRSWDPDAVGLLFPETVSSPGSSMPTVQLRTSSRRGGKGSDRAVKLLVAPPDPESQPAIVLEAAVPQLRLQAQADHDLGRAWGLPVVFRGLPRADGLIMQKGALEDFSA